MNNQEGAYHRHQRKEYFPHPRLSNGHPYFLVLGMQTWPQPRYWGSAFPIRIVNYLVLQKKVRRTPEG